jgi:hypothetical protein
MYCLKCGVQNSDNAKLCNSCGAVFSLVPPTPPKPIMSKTSGLAIASLVLGILSIFTFLLTAIPSIICGIISLIKIGKSGGKLTGKGFALTGIILPVIVLPIIALLMGILIAFRFQSDGKTVTWAQVIEPIRSARTISCDMIISRDENNLSMHEIIVGSHIRRTMSNIPNIVMILDMNAGKMLMLDSASMTATYVDIQGDLQNRTQSYINFLRDIITRLRDNPDIENLGEQLIDGCKVIGFRGKDPNDEVTIWADAVTALPVRVDLRVGQVSAILMNIELDALVDESLLSMDVPAGYTKKDTQLDLGNATEQDFVESLRVWAKVLGDGTFPDAIGTENAMKEMPMLVQKVKAMNLSEEQATKVGMAFGKGILFHQIIDKRGDDWKYVGAGVKLGDASRAVFWYRPEGSPNYRVIYGDLTVKDVAPENLPQ